MRACRSSLFVLTHLLLRCVCVCQVENGTWDANAIKSLEAATSFELVPSELRSTKPEAANGGADFDKPNLGYTIGGDDGLGETALLASPKAPTGAEGAAEAEALADVKPTRGRLLVFPHECPHAGRPVVDAPKVVLRGELWM